MNEDVEITLQQDSVEITEPLVADYILPQATSDTLGGVKIGDNVSVASDGTISIPKASGNTLGVIKVGSGLSIASDGTLSADGSTYTLPEATKTNLGGVYVDDDLSTTSAHPVQNSTVSLAIDQISDDLSTLSGTVGGLSTTVGNLSTTVGNLSGSLGTLSSDVDTNTYNIGINSGNITSLGNRVGTCEGNITTLQGYTTTLMTQTYESYAYDDIDDNVWTGGSIDLVGYGMNGYININLEGSLTISSGSSNTIFTLPTILPEYTVTGIAITDDAPLMIEVTDGGDVKLYNLSSSSIALTKLNANLAIQIGSENP